jgi:hypothetical protein
MQGRLQMAYEYVKKCYGVHPKQVGGSFASVKVVPQASPEARIALLERLLREYRVSEYEHDEDCRAGVSTVTGYVYDNRCDICKRTAAALTPPTAPEEGL